jgi:GDP/UDP-N,N'-diacetylbacillosamine 2-epimerase (hydrolysing)
MKLLFLLGSRGEWGYIKPLIDICKTQKIKYSICATNMVLLPNYGSLIKEVKKNYNVSDEIYMALEGSNHYVMTKSLGIFLSSFIDVIKRQKPSWIVLAGDRGEQLMGAIAGAYTYTPVAHIQAGERSGNIDGVARHSLSKLSHLHFASNNDAAKRLIKMGEEKYRIFNTGAPQIDDMKKTKFRDDYIKKNFNIDTKSPFILVVMHPVTEEYGLTENQVKILIDSLNLVKQKKIWILPNIDAGADLIRKILIENRNSDTLIFKNLSREIYLTLLKRSDLIIGNSSSGILEAPSYSLPAINLGRRQNNRVQAKNVINSEFKKEKILASIKKATSKKFINSCKNMKNPYGDGNSSSRIIEILKKTTLDDKLLIKNITY